MCSIRFFAADLFLENFQIPQKYGRYGWNRPLGPRGAGNVHNCSATFGLSRLATAHALGGVMIKAPLPETSHLLFDASSHANTSRGRNGTSLFMYSSTCFSASHFTLM